MHVFDSYMEPKIRYFDKWIGYCCFSHERSWKCHEKQGQTSIFILFIFFVNNDFNYPKLSNDFRRLENCKQTCLKASDPINCNSMGKKGFPWKKKAIQVWSNMISVWTIPLTFFKVTVECTLRIKAWKGNSNQMKHCIQAPTVSLYLTVHCSAGSTAALSRVEDWFNYHKQITPILSILSCFSPWSRGRRIQLWVTAETTSPDFVRREASRTHIVQRPLVAHVIVQTYSSQHSHPEIASYIFNNHSGALNCGNRHDSL